MTSQIVDGNCRSTFKWPKILHCSDIMERIRGAFGPDTFAFLKTGRLNMAILPLQDFWQRLQGLPFRGTYIADLVKHISDIGKSKKVAGASVEMTIATLATVVLAVEKLGESEEFRRAVEEARRRWNKGHAVPNKAADEFVSPLLAVALDGLTEETFTSLIKLSCQCAPLIRKFEDIKRVEYNGDDTRAAFLSDLYRHYGLGAVEISPKPRFSVLEGGMSCLMHGFIKQTLAVKGMIWTTALDSYYSLLCEASRSPAGQVNSASHCLQPTLHALTQLLRRFPLADPQVLGQLAVAIDLFRRWPVPAGRAAQRTLEVVFNENRTPGVTLVTALRDSFPYLDKCCLLQSTDETDKAAIASTVLLTDNEESGETGLFSLFEAMSRKSLSEVVQWQMSDGDRLCLLAHCLRIQVITYVYKRNVMVSLPPMHELGLEEVYDLYKQAVAVYEQTQGMNLETAKASIKGTLGSLLEEMEELSPDPANEAARLASGYFASGEKGKAPFIPTEYFTVELPDDGAKGNPPLIAPLSTRFGFRFARLVRRAKDPANPYYHSPIKVVVAGSDKLLHSFVSTYVSHLMEYPGDVSNLDVRVFVVPQYDVKSSMVQYLASVDSWYAKHVYVPFARRPFAPRLDLSLETKKLKIVSVEMNATSVPLPPSEEFNLDQIPPISILSNLLQDYVQEASLRLPVRIYSVKCWRGTDRSGEPDSILPLTMYLELGFPAVAMRAREAQPELSGKSLRDVVDQRLVRFTAPFVSVGAVQVDAAGVVADKVEETKKEVRYLAVQNIPRETDCWAEADPTSACLELSILEERAYSEEFTLQRKRKKGGKQRLTYHAAQLNSLYTNLHVVRTFITAESQSSDPAGFDILLDGVLYGPFGVIEVSPWILPGGAWPCLPIMTFLDPIP